MLYRIGQHATQPPDCGRSTAPRPATLSAIKSLVIPSGVQPGQRKASSVLVIDGASEKLLGVLSTKTGRNGVQAVAPIERIRQHERRRGARSLWNKATVRALQQQEATCKGSVSFERSRATDSFVQLDVAIPAKPGVLATAHGSFQCLRKRWVDDLALEGVPVQRSKAIQAAKRSAEDMGSRPAAGRCGSIQHNQSAHQ